jgi:hypothetical protein
MVRHKIHYRFPWSPAALEALPKLAKGRSLRQLARELKARKLVDQVVDAATVRRALEHARRNEAALKPDTVFPPRPPGLERFTSGAPARVDPILAAEPAHYPPRRR